MEVTIRLQRAGIKPAKGRYNYRVVAINKTRSRDSQHLEILGHYDPARQPAVLKIDLERVDKWVKKGASLSDTVKSLIRKIKNNKASTK